MNPLRTTSAVFAGIDFDRGRLFETRDADEAQALSGRVFSPHRLQLVGRQQHLHMRMDHLPVGPLSLSRLTWQAAVAVDPGQLEDYYLMCLPTKGRIEYCHGPGNHQALAGHLVIVGGAQRFHFSTSADYEQIVIRLDRSAVDGAWSALAGDALSRPICFRSEVSMHGPTWRALEPVLRLIADSARGDLADASLRYLNARLQDVLLTTLLLHQPHSQMQHRLPRTRATPACLKKAKAYMLERLDQPLTLMAVAQAVGVPARTLQLAFQVSDDMGPMQWLRAQRLRAVRAVLMAGGDGTTRVTDAAFRFGFTHLGEFSQQYRRTFDETPSQTLARRA
jgi:AraC-like DNA-binding protein